MKANLWFLCLSSSFRLHIVVIEYLLLTINEVNKKSYSFICHIPWTEILENKFYRVFKSKLKSTFYSLLKY